MSAGPKFKKHLNTCYIKVCGQGIRATSFTLCMLSPVRIVTWQSECIVLTGSRVANLSSLKKPDIVPKNSEKAR